MEPVYDQYALSVFVFAPGPRRLHFPQRSEQLQLCEDRSRKLRSVMGAEQACDAMKSGGATMRDAETVSPESAGTLERITTQFSTKSLAGPALQQQLSEIAARANLMNYFGSIVILARSSNGDGHVQFNDEKTKNGYSSVWPNWAFEMAQVAMLNAKKVGVLANGDPYGQNLVHVTVFA
jgi:hypothetical protein